MQALYILNNKERLQSSNSSIISSIHYLSFLYYSIHPNSIVVDLTIKYPYITIIIMCSFSKSTKINHTLPLGHVLLLQKVKNHLLPAFPLKRAWNLVRNTSETALLKLALKILFVLSIEFTWGILGERKQSEEPQLSKGFK